MANGKVINRIGKHSSRNSSARNLLLQIILLYMVSLIRQPKVWILNHVKPKSQRGLKYRVFVIRSFPKLEELGTSLVQWKRWHHRLNVWVQSQSMSKLYKWLFNVVWSFLLTVWTTAVRLCAELITRHIKIPNPFEIRGSFFEKVISTRRILVPLHLFFSTGPARGVFNVFQTHRRRRRHHSK
jgi:hypothetical protein